VHARDLDLLTLVTLAAPAVAETVVARLRGQGFDGVKASHGYVVQRLLEEEPTIGSLAAALGITQQGASKQVADLERFGYVERVRVPGDQRARRVRLTERGRSMVAATRDARQDLERQLRDAVGARKASAARDAMVTLVEVLGLAEAVQRRAVPPPQE
jgi:DNA-binding MarR family transcriptional regulator